MENQLGTFILGVIAAVVLVILWDNRNPSPVMAISGNGTSPSPSPIPTPSCGGSCSSCAAGIGGSCPSVAAAPAAQASLPNFGLEGMISPGTPPLNSVTGGQGRTSFYSNAGVTTDASFTFTPVPRSTLAIGTPVQPKTAINVPGSPTTPATMTPTRATQAVPNYTELGALNNYNVLGVPRKSLIGARYIQ